MIRETGVPRRLFSAALLILAPLAVKTGIAQAQTDDGELRLEEVIVTATKREATIEQVPIAVSTIGAEEIKNRGLERFEDYLATVPGVQYTPGGSVYTAIISMRGVNDPAAENGLTQAPVAVYLDEAPLTVSQGALNLDYSLFGVEQVTVIKGPHSTLYGASSLGGTLKVETRRPSVTDSLFEAQLGYSTIEGGGDGYTAAVSASAPLVEGKLAAEVTAYRIERGGYINDPTRGEEDINDTDATGVRVAVAWLPNDDVTVDARLYYQDFDANGLPFHAPSTVGDLISRPLDKPQTDGDEILLGSVSVNLDLGFADLVSATSAFERDNFLFRSGNIFGSDFRFEIESTAEAFVEELRLVSNSESPLEWLLGFYFSDETYEELGFLGSDFVPFFTQDLTTDIKTVALFGEASYALSDRLDLTAGVRVSRYDVDSDIIVGTFDFATFQVGQIVSNIDFDETDVSPRVALNFEIDRGSLYAQASRGFRIGQPNTPIPIMDPQFVDAFDSDFLWNYELGAKTEWWDERLRLNGAIFYVDWSDIQTTVFDSTGSFTFVTNAGSAEIKGLELEAVALLAQGLTLDAGFSYTDAEFATDVLSQGIRDGDQLTGVPEVQFSFGLQYDFDIGGSDAFVRGDYVYYDEFLAFDPFSFDPTSRIKNGDYERINLRGGMSFGNFQVTLFGTNLTDERPRMSVSAAFGEDASTIQPRTFGVNLNYQFR